VVASRIVGVPASRIEMAIGVCDQRFGQYLEIIYIRCTAGLAKAVDKSAVNATV
jgi:hypothetical protein